MKRNHHEEGSRSAVQQVRLESPQPTASAEDFDDLSSEAETLQTTGTGGGSGMLSNQQRVELSQASERNKQFLNTIQSAWPRTSA